MNCIKIKSLTFAGNRITIFQMSSSWPSHCNDWTTPTLFTCVLHTLHLKT